MINLIRRPAAPLAPYIEYLWYHEGLAWGWEWLLPDGAVEWIIDLTDGSKRWGDGNRQVLRTVRDSWISGQHSRPIAVEATHGSCMIGAHLRPGGAYPFLRQPLALLNDSVVELDQVVGRFASQLRERLVEAATPEARFRILEAALLQRLTDAPPDDGRVRHALVQLQRLDERLGMDRLAREVGLSQRRFSDLFQRRVGLPPKLFSRVMRLQRMLRSVERGAHSSWSAIAAEHGYFDHAHMTRDFVALVGMTPTDYAARKGAELNWVPID